jgi:hypothetical protein
MIALITSTIYYDVTPCSPVEIAEVSEKSTVSIFRLKKMQINSEQEASNKLFELSALVLLVVFLTVL